MPGTLDDNTALNRSTYDRIAALYAENQDRQQVVNGRWFPDLEEAFLQTVPVGGLVADLGCGPASDGARFAGQGHRIVGVDLSAGMLSVASRRLPGWVAQGDLRALPISGGRLDGIWCAAALLHVPEAATTTVLAEFHRALKPSGSLALVTALGRPSRWEQVPYAPSERRWFVYRSAGRLRRQLRDAGFRVRMEDQVSANRLWLTVLAGPAEGLPGGTQRAGP
jgi:SAM-dependent methyltransferase